VHTKLANRVIKQRRTLITTDDAHRHNGELDFHNHRQHVTKAQFVDETSISDHKSLAIQQRYEENAFEINYLYRDTPWLKLTEDLRKIL